MEVNADMTSTSTEPTCELAASSSQNSLSGSSFMEVNADMNSTSTEPTCELAASSCLHEEDVPGASVNGRKPSQLHAVELKRWLKCRAATTVGNKQDLVKQ